MVVGRVAVLGLFAFLLPALGCESSNLPAGTVTGADAARNDAAADAGPPDLTPFEAVGLRPTCGNGQLDPGEACDDGNTIWGDGCTGVCQRECPTTDPSCGGGRPASPACGDGFLTAGEACDDRNASAGDGCAADCAVIEAGWTCPVPGQRCFPICGDNVITPPETCDDGNQRSGDGCSSTCLLESPCFALDGSPVACQATCGNGDVDGAEECDDGPNNSNATDGCSTTCHRLYCGDGVVTAPETCDLGTQNAAFVYSQSPYQSCGFTCFVPHYCGDGIVDTAFGEQCDFGDRNGVPTDGPGMCVICNSDCMVPVEC